MDINVYLFIVIALMLLIIMYLLFVLRRVRTQLALIKDALEDIKGGNLNRRILAGENDMTKTICYDINKIAVNSQAQLIRQRQSEQAYKRLMTSLSHDVKTPLASLVGYLEAVENKIVIGEEKDEYIHVAHEKAHYMKSFVENLFEWVKLDSGEQIFHFEKFDLNELSRKGYVLPIGAALLYLVPVVLIPSGIMGLHPLASVMGIYPYISSDAAEMVKKWAGGIEITISPNICLISLLVIGSISAIVSVLALRKQTY